jgi:hypothetical protein
MCPAIAAICVIDDLLHLHPAIAICALMNRSTFAPLLLLCMDVLLCLRPATTTCVWMYCSVYALLLLLASWHTALSAL